MFYKKSSKVLLKRFKTIGIVGGNGFVGKTLSQKLSPHFDEIIVGIRNTTGFVSPFSNISAVQTDITDENSIAPFVSKCDVVINTANLIYESEHSYVDVLIEGTKHIGHHARKQNKQFIHFSCMGTRLDDISYWGDLKYRGEDMAYASQPDVVILKPNLILDARNQWFGTLCKRMTLGPISLVPGGSRMVQPTTMEEVYQTVLSVIQKETREKIYEIAGNEMTFSNAVKEQLKLMGRNPSVIGIPLLLGDSMVAFTQFLPNPIMTREVLSMLRNDIVTSEFQDIYQDRRELNTK
jgi:nucleoside-diphosphate-sugar epimerase